MIIVNGRLVARMALAALGVLSAVSDRVTGHEVLAGFTALLVAAGSAAWLRRDRLRGRRP